ncbi:MAG: VWA-like domain-containing protein [Eggerthellales bacterium]|nr:VWA-like domain-containing protein [Eggerthellales bacterium]
MAKAIILADNHFLSAAVGRLQVVPAVLPAPFSTDGYSLAFSPDNLFDQFKREQKAPKHDLLHTVLHCVFVHPYVAPDVNQRLWNLACDIAVERNVAELCGPRDGSRGAAISDALNIICADQKGVITAEKIYFALCAGKWAKWIHAWEELFYSDDHTVWYKWDSAANAADSSDGSDSNESAGQKDEKPQEGSGESSQGSNGQGNTSQDQPQSQPQGQSHADGQSQSQGQSQADGQSEPQGDDARDSSSAPSERDQGHGAGSLRDDHFSKERGWGVREAARPDLEAEKAGWNRVAKALSVNLQTYAKARGKSLTSMIDELEESTHERVDYGDFLRQFAIPGEVLKVSEDEFDYIFYTYGLNLYGNLPLIEPLEYRDEKRIREFVIVIDTSGSVQGEIVRKFIDTTFDILKSTEAFFERIHVRIIQCDAQVQSDDVITSLDELKEWGRTMKIYGGGGTDFAPAFQYVDSLIEQGEFENLGGLIYFTDGWGDYPNWMPEYKTAFVFYDEDYRPELVPTWAVQIVLDEHAVTSSKFGA